MKNVIFSIGNYIFDFLEDIIKVWVDFNVISIKVMLVVEDLNLIVIVNG